MHRLLLGFVVIGLASTVFAQRPSGLDGPIPTFQVPAGLPACSMESIILRFARATHVLVGFERTSNCVATATADPSIAGEVLSGMSVRAALDRLMVLDTSYRWEERDGVAVIRPAAAWTDPNNALNLPAHAFDVADADLGVTLGASLTG